MEKLKEKGAHCGGLCNCGMQGFPGFVAGGSRGFGAATMAFSAPPHPSPLCGLAWFPLPWLFSIVNLIRSRNTWERKASLSQITLGGYLKSVRWVDLPTVGGPIPWLPFQDKVSYLGIDIHHCLVF